MRGSQVPGLMRHHKTILLLCIFGFFAINVTSLNDRPATLDDFDSTMHTSPADSIDLLRTVASVADRSPQHVPAYSIIMDVWRALVGADLFQARLLSAFLGLLTIALTHRLALITGNQQAAIAAPLIMALFAYFQYYSQIARVYSLLPVVTGWLLWAYWQVLISPRVSRWKWLSLFASVVAILYVHYVSILFLAAIAFYHLFFVPKRRRWWQTALVMGVACLPFLVWLPVALDGFAESQGSRTKDALALPEAAGALLRIYSNGLWILPLAAAAILWLRRRRLNAAERYLALVTLAIFLIILLVNEVTPILIARRIRYTLVLALPLSCAFAIALSHVPGWRVLRLPFLALGIVSSVAFASSSDLKVFTNRQALDMDSVPHYQDFIYEAPNFPGHHEPILSFLPHATDVISWFLPYYRQQLSKWTHVINMSRDERGQLIIESSLSTYASPEAIIENSQGIWVIHNPELVSDSALETDFGWFTQQFRFCNRYLEKPKSIIDFYLKSSIPCEIVTDEQPLAIRYDNGTELGNLIYDLNADSLTVFVRWISTIDKAYSFTLQIFDGGERKMAQFDKVISGDPIDIASFNLSDFPGGDYVVKFIVYDFESKASQPGAVTSDGQAFERDVNILQFSVSG